MHQAAVTFASELVSLFQLVRREKLLMLLGWMVVVVFSGSLVFYFAEQGHNANIRNYSDALYWSVVSATTVGYGDIAPVTSVGRVSAIVMLVTFLALMPLLGATVTSIYVSKKIKGESGLERLSLIDHVLILGWNNNGDNILSGLQERSAAIPVVIVAELAPDHFENLVDRFPLLKLHYVRGPHQSEPTLQRANAHRASVGIILSSYSIDSTSRSDELAVLAVLALREMAPGMRIVAECFASGSRGHLKRAGANRVIVSGELDGYLLTAAAMSPGLATTIKDAMTFGQGNDLWTEPIPPEFTGKTFKDLASFWLMEKCWILLRLISKEKKLGIDDLLSGDQGSIDEFIIRRFQSAGRGTKGAHHLHFLNPGPEHVIRADDVGIVIYPVEN